MKLKYFAIIIIWFVIFIGDGTVLPALTGLPFGFGIMILLSVMAITFGIQRWVIYLGIILAGLTELMIGAYFGTVIGAWLVMAWLWHILNNFLNMKSMSENDSLMTLVPFTLFGLGLFGLGEGVSWLINRFVYEPELAITNFVGIFCSPTMFSIVVIELTVTLFIFHFIYFSRNDQ